MGRATEELAARSGPGIGGLLNVTFGNAPELIIALFALGAGLHEVVKASIIGSILGNMLLVLGAAMFVGGLKRDRQYFDRTAAERAVSMLLLAAAALVMPAIFELVEGSGLPQPGAERDQLRRDRRGSSRSPSRSCSSSPTSAGLVVLAEHPPRPVQPGPRGRRGARHDEPWTVRKSVIALAVAGVPVGVMSEILVGSISEAVRDARAQRVLHRRHRRGDRRQRGRALGRGAGRAQEQDGPGGQHRDRLERADRAVRRARARAHVASSSARTRWRSCSTASSSARSCWPSIIANHVTHEGESTWFEGLQLLAVYVVLGIAFYLA